MNPFRQVLLTDSWWEHTFLLLWLLLHQ
jgi:hypothetical protein